jgi:hypothetical protein
MQEDFLCSPINRQVGCKQFTSSVVGGPATTVLPVCSVFLCDDNCTTGNLTYQITPLDSYYGKKIVIIKTVNTTATGFKVRLTSASANFVSNGTGTFDLPNLPSTVELTFPIGAGGEIGVVSYDSSSGSSVNIYNTDGTLTSNRVMELGGRSLTIQGGGTISIGTTSTNSVSIGRNLSTLNLINNNIVATNLGQIAFTTPNTSLAPYNVLLMNTATKVMNSVPVNYFTRSLFSILPATSSGTIAKSTTTSLTPWSAGAIPNTYVIDASSVVLATGTITVPESTTYMVTMKVDLKNSIAAGRYTLELYDSFTGTPFISSEQNSPVVDDYTTCMLTANVMLLTSPRTYTFRIVNRDTGGVTSYRSVLMSITRI